MHIFPDVAITIAGQQCPHSEAVPEPPMVSTCSCCLRSVKAVASSVSLFLSRARSPSHWRQCSVIHVLVGWLVIEVEYLYSAYSKV